MHSLLTAALMLFSAHSHASTVKYYYGDVKYYTPEGKLSGEGVSLVKRVFDPEHNKIVESVLQPGDKPGQQAQEYVVEMVRQTGNVFKMSNNTGSLSFYGREWDWNNWDYSIQLDDGATLTGSGFLNGKHILTSKTLIKRQPYLKVVERLSEIPGFEYERLHDLLQSGRQTP